jgi:hypothetical protein
MVDWARIAGIGMTPTDATIQRTPREMDFFIAGQPSLLVVAKRLVFCARSLRI